MWVRNVILTKLESGQKKYPVKESFSHFVEEETGEKSIREIKFTQIYWIKKRQLEVYSSREHEIPL